MKVFHQADLTARHTFGLPAKATALCVLDDAQRLPEVLALPEYERETVLFLGGGSNVLFLADYPALVVQMQTRGIRLLADDGQQVWVAVAAGESWDGFVRHALQMGWFGLENLSLIPGTVGAAPVQNIGAYGVEVGSRIVRVHAFDLDTQAPCVFERDECAFAYRDSVFKHTQRRYVITEVEFVLDKIYAPQWAYGDVQRVAQEMAGHDAPDALQVAAAVRRIRQSKLPDPAVIGNCGSFYHNPIVSAEQAQALLREHPNLPTYPQADGCVKLAAGWLIEACGLKGHACGKAAVHDKQALVLVNRGGATADDVRQLSAHITASVVARFGVQLNIEPLCLG